MLDGWLQPLQDQILWLQGHRNHVTTNLALVVRGVKGVNENGVKEVFIMCEWSWIGYRKTCLHDGGTAAAG